MTSTRESGGDLTGRNVLLLDCHTVQALPVMKAFRRLGCVVTAVSRSRFDLGVASRYRDRHVVIPVKAFEEEEYVARLTEILRERRYDAVVPLTDSTARALSRHKEALGELAGIAVADREIFDRIDDKRRTMLACRENGIPCPKTYSISEDVGEIARAIRLSRGDETAVRLRRGGVPQTRFRRRAETVLPRSCPRVRSDAGRGVHSADGDAIHVRRLRRPGRRGEKRGRLRQTALVSRRRGRVLLQRDDRPARPDRQLRAASESSRLARLRRRRSDRRSAGRFGPGDGNPPGKVPHP